MLILKTSSIKNWWMKEQIKITQLKFYMKELEKENQCLKNEIKNQQTAIEMLITNDNCVDEWKTVKTKSKNNTNIASLSSVSQKTPSPVNFQN